LVMSKATDKKKSFSCDFIFCLFWF
jgi:hypothetical protein